MSEININLSSGESKRLLTAGKYCPNNIVVTAESGGGSNDDFTLYIEGNLTELNSNATFVNDSAFGAYYPLETVNLPLATNIGGYAFANCESLQTVKIPNVINIHDNAFEYCNSLLVVDCSALCDISHFAFTYSGLQALVIRNTSTVAQLNMTNAFDDTPISNGNGYIYVPRSMIDAYVNATNWSVFADQLRVLEDYTVDGTINGELDVEFSDNEIECLVLIWNIDGGHPQEVPVGVVTANPEMTWGELVFGENNGGAWSASDEGFVMYDIYGAFDGGEYYVFNPNENVLITLNHPIGYLLLEYDEPFIAVITAEEAQNFM